MISLGKEIVMSNPLTFDMTEFEFRKIIKETIRDKENIKYIYSQIRNREIIFLK